MIINYLHEGGPFGSYRNKRSPESIKRATAKELTRIARTALLEKMYMKIEVLINEYLDENYEIYLNNDNSGLSLVGKNGNKKGAYGGWNGIKDAMPVFRLALENNTVVVILSCMPFNNEKIVVQSYMGWFGWMRYLKRFLNANIDRITETGLSFNYDGFDVKVEMDQDILDNDGRVKVSFMSIIHTHSIDGIQEFVDHFYNQDVRIKTDRLVFHCSMSSNEMYQQYIDRFPYLVRSTGSIAFDMHAMREFDLENLRITSVLADPHSDVEIYYDLKLDNKVSETSLQGINNFIHNEYNTTLEKFKEIAYQNKGQFDWDLRSPKDVRRINVSYKYNNPKDLEIKGMSRAI
jgi:hypothetical protein